ncbi:hypothetical protein [Actinocorallia longicatena]|uniref:Uncharacterized protein n=1 Tax=Actinocorallia longicatena TaxID=111803 RepID=A0ABP6QCD8_9ACTN
MLNVPLAPRERSLSESTAAMLAMLAAVVLVAANVADFLSGDRATATVAWVDGLGFHQVLPMLVAACLMPVRSLFPLGAAITIGYGPLRALDAAGRIEAIARGGHEEFALGAGLALIAGALLLCATGCSVAALAGHGELRRSRRWAVLWAAAGGLLALVQLVGLWLPWTRVSVEMTRDERRVVKAHECCTMFTSDGTLSSNVLTVAGTVLAAVVLTLALCLLSRAAAAGMIIGVGAFYLRDVLASGSTWLMARVAQKEVLAEMGAGPEELEKYRPEVSVTLLPGMWISTAGVGLIVLAAVARTVTRAAPEEPPEELTGPVIDPYGIERPHPGVEVISSPGQRWNRPH